MESPAFWHRSGFLGFALLAAGSFGQIESFHMRPLLPCKIVIITFRNSENYSSTSSGLSLQIMQLQYTIASLGCNYFCIAYIELWGVLRYESIAIPPNAIHIVNGRILDLMLCSNERCSLISERRQFCDYREVQWQTERLCICAISQNSCVQALGRW